MAVQPSGEKDRETSSEGSPAPCPSTWVGAPYRRFAVSSSSEALRALKRYLGGTATQGTLTPNTNGIEPQTNHQ